LRCWMRWLGIVLGQNIASLREILHFMSGISMDLLELAKEHNSSTVKLHPVPRETGVLHGECARIRSDMIGPPDRLDHCRGECYL